MLINSTNLQKILKYLIANKGLTQTRIALTVGVTPGTIGKWLDGEHQPAGYMWKRVQKLNQFGIDKSLEPVGNSARDHPEEWKALLASLDQEDYETARELGARYFGAANPDVDFDSDGKRWSPDQYKSINGAVTREWRTFKGYTQAEVGEWIGISGAALGRIERGEITIRQDHLEALLELTGLKEEDVVL